METPRSLKRKNFFSPSRHERDGHVAHILSPFEKRMRTAQWGAFQNVRAALFPSSLDPKGVALRDFYHGHGSSVGSFSPSARLSPRALPSSVGPPFSPLALSSSGRPPRQALTIAPSTVSSTFSSYPRFRDRELEALRLELKKHQEFSRGAMELVERAHARDLKQTAELEMFKLEVSKIFERRDAGHILSQMRDAGQPPPQEFQNLSGQTGGSNFLPGDNFRDISSSSVYGDGAVSVGAMPRGGSQSDEVNVPSSRSGGEDNQEPEWKQLLNKANSKDKTTSLSKEIEYTLSKLQALQLERPSWFKVEKKPLDKTLVDAFTPLSAEAELAVDEALGGGDRHEILVTHEKSNIDVTRAVMQCLSPGVWLNDEVINVYMELLKEREIREPDRFLKCHFFNTFFYNKLYKDKRSYDYKAIRRWTTQKKLGYSLSDCDKILVPIHQDIHWCLAVINIRDKRLEYLDSLKGGDHSVLDVLSRYITDEAKDKDGKVLDVSTWDQDFPKNIPEQLNGCDCGMFMVKYADFHSRGAPLQFTQDNMEYFRKKMVWEILDLKAT